MTSPNRPPTRAGFSLVEVALAIGILGFCMVSILGLLPIALTSTRHSMERTLEIRILQTIRADLLDKPFSTLPNSGTYSFDADGNPVATPSAEEPAPHYTATYSQSAFISLPDAQKNTRMATCRVSILNTVRNETRVSSIHLPDNGF